MRSFVIIFSLALIGHSLGQQHQQIDPAYLRQYYQQLQQQTGAAPSNDATPIYEQNSEQTQQQYVSPGQQLRVKDNVQEQIQYQPQQVAYRQPQAAAPAPRRPQPQQLAQQYQPPRPKGKPQLEQEEEEYDDQNSSYQFGFDVKDDEFTNYQNRKEVRDGSVIKGSYSVVDSDGFIRTVKYTADPKEGFKAEVIREPTDIVVKIPTPQPPQQQQQHLLRPHHAPVKAQDYNLKQQYPHQQYQH
ncbi:activating signal cointegrator 1 complex subunit 2 homolog isoform X2 [Lucilia cuprina]|uniref:activating signal cointegrator 1 complex subunit 2 homolog isoform X2 n=1 Tax=Lucilia cuprina TaxID=7375 RepID=UPI001F05E955|nr:activating signal cointegrator 1 complex subunit 2 homolog isoform X2 [Lucilia cuprina]